MAAQLDMYKEAYISCTDELRRIQELEVVLLPY